MKEVHLPCGKIALISDEDWLRVSKLSWYDRGGGCPAARYKKSVGGHGRLVMMHRFIMSAPVGYVVNHIDWNPLNNTRENLQITTQSRSLMRSPKKRGGIDYRYGKWYARMRIDGVIVRLGSFSVREDAEAMIEAARELVWSERFNDLGTIL